MSKTTRRQFLEESLLAAAAASAVPLLSRSARAQEGGAASPNEVVRVGVVGVRGRGRGHVSEFMKSKDSVVAAICDPDQAVVDMALRAAPDARYYRDVRALLEDDSIDAISIATPNHWHSLATIWALQAGKHVYVEKPLSHNVHEGRVAVDMARKSGLVVQHGTQARSDPATREAMQWLNEGGLGKVHVARALCYKRRKSIGKVDGPQAPPETLDYDLWTGPAELQPLMRKSLHYDWHWVFNTGNGDLGNQGVHQMDIARWGLGKDELPRRVVSCGGRLGYVDDGDTPNTQIAVCDYGDQKLVFEVRGLETDAYRGAHIGVIFHCEMGYLVSSSYTKVVAFDHDGKELRTFTGGGNHFQDFLDAVKQGDPAAVHAPPLEGHLSAALCHLANISYRLGAPRRLDASDEPFGDAEAANESFRRFRGHLVANGLDASTTDYAMGPELAFDPAAERFTGEHAEAANALLTREYREGFVVPSRV